MKALKRKDTKEWFGDIDTENRIYTSDIPFLFNDPKDVSELEAAFGVTEGYLSDYELIEVSVNPIGPTNKGKMNAIEFLTKELGKDILPGFKHKLHEWDYSLTTNRVVLLLEDYAEYLKSDQ